MMAGRSKSLRSVTRVGLSGNQIDNIIYTGDDTYWFQTYYSLIRLDRKTNSINVFMNFSETVSDE